MKEYHKPRKGEIFLKRHGNKYVIYHVMNDGRETDFEDVEIYECQYWEPKYDDYIVGWLREEEIDKGKLMLERYLKRRNKKT